MFHLKRDEIADLCFLYHIKPDESIIYILLYNVYLLAISQIPLDLRLLIPAYRLHRGIYTAGRGVIKKQILQYLHHFYKTSGF